MRLAFWVKFDNLPPQKWRADNFEAFWNNLKETMLTNNVRLEWIIRD